MSTQPRHDPLDLVGTVVAEKYAVEAVVGEGGFAVVYRAEHTLWKRPVALKVFRALDDVRAEDRAKLLEDFVREGALLAELSEQSTAICQARDVGMLKTARGTDLPYMVLEWLEGRSLDAVLLDEKERALPLRTLAETLALLGPAADALGLAHERGIAHRDVKPANIFVLGGDARASRATVKLLDFGIAKVVQDAQKMAASFSKTQGQATSFTPAYGAPEQFSRQYGATGPWTDTFALALIVAEVMTGRDPLDGSDIGQLAFASIDPARRPTPRAHGAEVSDAVEAVFAKAVAVKSEERFASARLLWAALRSVAAADAGAAAARADLAGARDPALDATAAAPAPAEAPRPDAPRGAVASTGPSEGPAPAVASAGPAKETGAAGRAAAAVTPVEPPSGGATSRAAASPSAPPSSGGRTTPVVFGIGMLAVAFGIALFVTRDRGASSPPVASVAGAAQNAGGHAASAGAHPAGVAASVTATCPADMRQLAGGSVQMGNSDAEDANEKPVHEVVLDPFCVDAHEVTVAKYQQCVERDKCDAANRVNDWPKITAAEHATYDPLCNARDPERRGEHPVNCVNWQMAAKYCLFRGKRLPTEAEWEFTARGRGGQTYPWGDEDPGGKRVNACGAECVKWKTAHHAEDALSKMYAADDGFDTTAPVGSFPQGRTAAGVSDMVGNVAEWVDDWFGPYEDVELGKSLHDPRGPKTGEQRVIRGGAWNSVKVAWLRPSFRYMALPTMKSHGIGFRCAKTL